MSSRDDIETMHTLIALASRIVNEHEPRLHKLERAAVLQWCAMALLNGPIWALLVWSMVRNAH